jgi:predicted O-methyltransferase YrrM
MTLAWKLHRHFRVTDDLGALRKLFGRDAVTDAQISALLDELTASERLAGALRGPDAQRWLGESDIDRLPTQLALDGPGRARAIFLYVAIRVAQPETVVETGCFTGWDSAVILEALERNRSGRLFTIDLPAEEGLFSQLYGHRSGLLPGLDPGFLVPEPLRERWTLTLGNVRTELAPLLEDVGVVDMFFHDSDHTYEHMMWEFTTVWPYLAADGLLVSDDISWNSSIRDFARGVRRPLVILRGSPNLGALSVAAALRATASASVPAVVEAT